MPTNFIPDDSVTLGETPQASTAAGRVYDDLRLRILAMELPPGSTLSRPDLARDYGVSQTPVRRGLFIR